MPMKKKTPHSDVVVCKDGDCCKDKQYMIENVLGSPKSTLDDWVKAKAERLSVLVDLQNLIKATSAKIDIGIYTLSLGKEGYIWVTRNDEAFGEGMEVAANSLEPIIDKFYKDNF